MIFLVLKFQHAHVLEDNIHVGCERVYGSLVHLIPNFNLFTINYTLNLRLHQDLALCHYLVIENVVLVGIKCYQGHLIRVLSLIVDVVLSLLEIHRSALQKSNKLFHFSLVFPIGLVHLGYNFSFFEINLLSKFFKLTGDHVSELLVALIDVSLSSFQFSFLNLQLFTFLNNRVDKLVEIRRDLWEGLTDGLDLMALMLTVNDTFSTNRWTLASETEVAHELLRMRATRSTASR